MLLVDTPGILAALVTLPVSCCLAALVSQLRWDLSLGVPTPPKKTDEDAVDQALDHKEASEKEAKPMPWKLFISVMIGVLALSFGLGYAIQALPGQGPNIAMCILAAICISIFSGPILVELCGLGQAGMIRNEDGIMRRVKSWRSKQQAYTTHITMILLVALIAPIYVWGEISSCTRYLLLAIPLGCVPMALGTLFNDSKKPSASFRGVIWQQTKFCGMMIASVTISMSLSWYFNSDGADKKPDNKPSVPIHPGNFDLLFLFQPLIFMGRVIAVVSQLYRIDVMLGRKRRAERELELEALSHGYETRVCAFSDTVTDDFGVAVKEPTLFAYLAKQGKHLVWPFYALLGAAALETSVILSASAIAVLFPTPEAAPVEHPFQGVQLMVGAFIAAPLFIAPTIALVSFLRGEMQVVWNWQADWTAPKKVEEAATARGDIKEKEMA